MHSASLLTNIQRREWWCSSHHKTLWVSPLNWLSKVHLYLRQLTQCGRDMKAYLSSCFLWSLAFCTINKETKRKEKERQRETERRKEKKRKWVSERCIRKERSRCTERYQAAKRCFVLKEILCTYTHTHTHYHLTRLVWIGALRVRGAIDKQNDRER